MIPGSNINPDLRSLPGAEFLAAICIGLAGLGECSARSDGQGARFAPWGSVLQITSDGWLSGLSIREQAWELARWA